MPDRLRIVLTHKPEAFANDGAPGKLEFVNTPPAPLIADLKQRGFQRCAILGGSQIHSLFLEAGLVDELWLTLEPLLFGSGTPLLARPTTTKLSHLSSEKLGPSTLLHKYQVEK
jgi:riboflavin biosynthesis pyrimidine reductase